MVVSDLSPVTSELPAFLISLAWNTGIFIILMAVFLHLLRHNPRTTPHSRTKITPVSSSSLWKWVVGSFTASDEELRIRLGSSDAAVLLRFYRVMLGVFFKLALVGACVLLPVNSSGSVHSGENDFSVISIGNIESGSAVFWLHFLACYAMSFFIFSVVVKEMKFYFGFRQMCFLSNNHSFLVRLTPTIFSRSGLSSNACTSDDFLDALEQCFAGQVKYYTLITDTTKIGKLLVKRTSAVEKLRKAIDRQNELQLPLTHFSCWKCRRVNSIATFEQAVIDIDSKLRQLQRNDNSKPILGVIVTLKTQQCSIMEFPNVSISASPNPEDFNWDSLSTTPAQDTFRLVVSTVLVTFLLIFYVIPVSLVAGLASFSNIAATFPSIPIPSTAVLALLENWISALVLVIFMSFLPKVLLALSIWENRSCSISGFQRSLMNKMFYFQFFNTFLTTTIAGSFFYILEQIYLDPTVTPLLLATSLPENSTFFISYLMFSCFVLFPLELCRIPELLLGFPPGVLNIGGILSIQALVVVISLTYALLSPVLLLFSTMYFVIALPSHHFILEFCFPPLPESGAKFYPKLLSRSLLGLAVAQLTLLGYFLLKDCSIQAYLLCPLVIATFFVDRLYVRTTVRHEFSGHSFAVDRPEPHKPVQVPNPRVVAAPVELDLLFEKLMHNPDDNGLDHSRSNLD